MSATQARALLDRVRDGHPWWELLPELDPSQSDGNSHGMDVAALAEHVDELRKKGKQGVDTIQELQGRYVSSDVRWLQTVSAKGTLGDRIVAHLMICKSNPLLALPSIKALCEMGKTRGEGARRAAVMAIDTLHEVFTLYNFLPRDRLLR